jgi:hypothetical protein
MIDTVLNLLLNCPHRHLTRPFTPVNHDGVATVKHMSYASTAPSNSLTSSKRCA